VNHGSRTLAGRRHVAITERRTARDWAFFIKGMLDERYAQAIKVRLVMDNLNTHTTASLYEAFEPEEAWRLARRLEIQDTPNTAVGSMWPRLNSVRSIRHDGPPALSCPRFPAAWPPTLPRCGTAIINRTRRLGEAVNFRIPKIAFFSQSWMLWAMQETLGFLTRHGAVVLFAAVFVEQIGIPLPAVPWMFAAGALIGAGKMNWLVALGPGIAGSLLADLIWFYLGRRYGHRVLGLLCRISLEPDSCVRRTQDVFTRYGIQGVVAAKFIPGLSTLAPPLAGNSGFSLPRFLFFDGLGSLLYVGSFLVVGVLFSRQLEAIMAALASLGTGALGVVAGLVALYFGYKFFQRHRLLRELRMARITVDELHQKLEAGENPMILDLRSHAALEEDPSLIRGALHMSMDEVDGRVLEIPRDRDIILYCSCPNEVSSARVALLLQRKGFSRVRPLLGGFDAWREKNYPIESRAVRVS
jgi:membrane protein DedA with SNARE-associated domain